MRFAYADPPYIGQARKHYSHDAKCAEVDHAQLIDHLQEYDGWALSMSAAMYSLKEIIAFAPEGSRLAAWVKPFAAFKPNVNPAYTWEPVLYRSVVDGSDRDLPTVKDHVIESITMKRGLAGAKPDRFCFWLFDLLGMNPEDEFDDLFPGTGAVSMAWDRWRRARSNDGTQMEFAA